MIEQQRSFHVLVAVLVLAATLGIGGCAAVAPASSPANTARATTPVSLAAEVSVADAAALRDAGALVLDVREPDEWAAGHIPGATLIPLGQLPSRLGELPNNETIVVVCRSGNRSAQGRDILRQAGFAATTSMTGGMNDWVAEGLPVETGS